MPGRAEEVRIASARLIITTCTVLVGMTVAFSLAVIAVKSVTVPGYLPKAWFNTLLCAGMVIAGFLALKHLDVSWRRAFVLYFLFDIAAYAAMTVLEYRLYVLRLGEAMDFAPLLYLPHLTILAVAIVVGFKASWLVTGATVAYIFLVGHLKGDIYGTVPTILVALTLPFTAILVERLLDEVEKEACRAYHAETSISVMAHDLGNPLSVLSSSLEVLEREKLTPEQRETLMRAIQRNTNTLRRLLEEFREFPYLDKAVPMEMVDLRGIVRDVVELYARPMSKEYGQTLNADLQPVEVIGTASRLGRMTRELLMNAVKYTPRGGRIEVTLQADEQVILQISDSGWGIKEEELAYVFDLHWRGSNVSPRGVSGTGLGLFICKTIAESHGGRIEVESQQDKGSTFTVYLPLPETAAALSSSDASPTQERAASRLHIFPLGVTKKDPVPEPPYTRRGSNNHQTL